MDRSLSVRRLSRIALVSGVLTLSAFAAEIPTQVVIPPDEVPKQYTTPQAQPALLETSRFIRVVEARSDFKVTGKGLAAAVLDSGLNTGHVDFAGRVPIVRNFTGGSADDVTDRHGHGTNVAGIIGANRDHVGIAPDARIIPIKVLDDHGSGEFTNIEKGLQWVIDNREKYDITVVNMSLGARVNLDKDDDLSGDGLREKVRRLRDVGVPVVIAAGNDYHRFQSQGMGYPAIIRESISVGAVYDAGVGAIGYQSGAQVFSTGPGRITPFSQRLHRSRSAMCQTDVFAPGAPLTSSGNAGLHGESVQHGTSQAGPVVAGVILLMQEYFKKRTGALPTVDEVEGWLRESGIVIKDGDDEDDNVVHTGLEFARVDALAALVAVQRSATVEALKKEGKIF